MINKQFYSNFEAKLEFIGQAKTRLKGLPIADIPVTRALAFSYDSLANDPKAISCLKESVFASKELFDSLLVRLNKVNNNISTDYEKFVIALFEGKYDVYKELSGEINFLKRSIKFIHCIRETRNRLKSTCSTIKVYLENQKYFVKLDLDLNPTSMVLKNILKIKNFDQVEKTRKYYIKIGIESFIDEQINFWRVLNEKSVIFNN